MPNKGEKFHIKWAMQLIFVIVANLIHAHIIVADSKSDSIIVVDFCLQISNELKSCNIDSTIDQPCYQPCD